MHSAILQFLYSWATNAVKPVYSVQSNYAFAAMCLDQLKVQTHAMERFWGLAVL